ncbi:MAG: hypothetical protein IKT68_05575 [Clostridia bacterium]|nr:hypothetical protein [Clostridia bacterium]
MAEQFKEAVCVDAGRVYDSCCDRDCLEDLRLYFSPDDQLTVNQAIGVRARSATLLTTVVDVEPVTFKRGYYSVDMVFYFLVSVDLYVADTTAPTTVNGIATFNKRVILFGSEGNAQVFSSTAPMESTLPATTNVPTAYVQAVDPIILSATVNTCIDDQCAQTINAPAAVLNVIGGTLAPVDTIERFVGVTLGIFTVVQLVRNVQMLVPVYDFCVPDKECITTTDDPCEMFNRIQFPLDEFFPPREFCENEVSSCMPCNAEN